MLIFKSTYYSSLIGLPGSFEHPVYLTYACTEPISSLFAT